MFKIKSRVNH